MKRKLLLPFLGVLTLSTLYAAPSGEKLFDAKCAACHVKVRPSDKSTLIAPPAMGVMRHVKMQYTTQKSALDFMQNYVMKPERNKAVCASKTIQRFGVMPSQKGALTEDELRLITTWMYENIIPTTNMSQTDKKCAQNTQKSKPKSSPFLISSGLPHMTKMIKQNWDNTDLSLSSEQKKKLLVVRKTTIKGIRALKPQIIQLEKQIKKMAMNGKALNLIDPKLNTLAKLKANISKVHIRCIHDSKNILTKKQVQFLLNK